jgi:hypothetical protein
MAKVEAGAISSVTAAVQVPKRVTVCMGHPFSVM